MEKNYFSRKSLEDYSRTLEAKSEECNQELKTKNEQLEQAQQQLQLAQEQIVAQRKLADLGTRTAEVVHDLKNPLYYISNLANFSAKSIDNLMEKIEKHLEYLDEEIVENINKDLLKFVESIAAIKHQAKKGYRTVDSVMVGVHNESSEPELTDINELIALSSKADSLAKVFTNLIENGCYAAYTKKKTAGELFQPTVSIKVENLEDYIAINIEDNGQGIPKVY